MTLSSFIVLTGETCAFIGCAGHSSSCNSVSASLLARYTFRRKERDSLMGDIKERQCANVVCGSRRVVRWKPVWTMPWRLLFFQVNRKNSLLTVLLFWWLFPLPGCKWYNWKIQTQTMSVFVIESIDFDHQKLLWFFTTTKVLHHWSQLAKVQVTAI